MSTVNPTGTVPQSLLDTMNNTAAKSAAAPGSVQDIQDNFMQLLVTQLKNQDPLNPMDNAQVTSQLAQLSTVSGINKLNGSLASLLDNFNAGQTMQATSMIGHGVFVAGNSMTLANKAASLGVKLADRADSVVVSIKDGSGKEVQRIDLGAQEAGILPLNWDGSLAGGGTAADGKYSFSVTATRAGTPVSASPLSFAMVASVTTGSGGIKLNLTNDSIVGMADVLQIH